jgi:hypothetical protein
MCLYFLRIFHSVATHSFVILVSIFVQGSKEVYLMQISITASVCSLDTVEWSRSFDLHTRCVPCPC